MRTAAMAMIWMVVLILPSQEGRKRRKPVTILIAAAPTMMKMSRLKTAAVTQKGTGKWRGKGGGMIAGIERTTNEVTSRSLSAINRSEEHTSELQSRSDLVCRLLLEKKKQPER